MGSLQESVVKAVEVNAETTEVGDYEITRFKDCKKILAIKERGRFGRKIRLGQRVYANGRFGADAGTLGIVVEIGMPYEKGKTCDIIHVWFEGRITDTEMKFKDFTPESFQD